MNNILDFGSHSPRSEAFPFRSRHSSSSQVKQTVLTYYWPGNRYNTHALRIRIVTALYWHCAHRLRFPGSIFPSKFEHSLDNETPRWYFLLHLGAWLSWLERRVHIAEIAGSSPAAPISPPSCLPSGRHEKFMTKSRYLRFTLAVLLFLVLSPNLSAQDCFVLTQPTSGTTITSEACTLSVRACEDIREVAFSAFVPVSEDSYDTLLLGTISRPPFKMIWDIGDLPNRLFSGVIISAEATYRNGATEVLRREGIWLAHNAVTRPNYPIEFAKSENSETVPEITVKASPSPPSYTARAYWNDDGLTFDIQVNDPYYYRDLPADKYAELGVEILLSRGLTDKPYPDTATLWYILPLIVKPYRITAQPGMEQGRFEIQRMRKTVDFPFIVKTEDFKGFGVRFTIPLETFGPELPDTLGMNIIANVLNRQNDVERMSWVNADPLNLRSPLVYGKAPIQERSPFANTSVLWVIAFAAGILIGVLGVGLSKLASRGDTPRHARSQQKQDELFEKGKRIMEAELTNGSFSVRNAASMLSVSPRALDTAVRRASGENFQDFLMRSRVEIAKERLRSSHSSETAIASSCGFRSVDEMEKQFRKICRTTPYRFREENQVA